jgi:D-lactate dehydrogenase
MSHVSSLQPSIHNDSTSLIRAQLEEFLQPAQVLTKAIERVAFSNDAGCYRLTPQAVVRPASLSDIEHLIAWSAQSGIPLTFRAGGTSLSGQAVGEGVIVDLARGWEDIRILDGGARVWTQCGIVGYRVNEHLRAFRRKLGPDPASMNAALVGGIIANNASGMCCGVLQNSYHTLDSMRLVLAVKDEREERGARVGLTLDTSDLARANDELLQAAPELASGILALKREMEANAPLAERIRHKYKIKNTVGYAINAFLDYDTPVEIIRHLMVGSEGTLGFIADATWHTVADMPLKYTGLLFFQTVPDACAAVLTLRDSGAAAVELMDYACLWAMREQYGAPKDIIASLPNTACALLVEYQASEREEFQALQARAAQTLAVLREAATLVAVLDFTDDYKQQAKLWKLRKGILPVVSAARRAGTTVITEDIAFPIEAVAPAIAGLQALFVKHNYPDGVIFGHAKDGNLHFNVAQSFSTDADVRQFEAFLNDIATLVVERYDGSLKAEHGTGRNMAPFVEREWGAEAYGIMRRLKKLLDPHGILNPGVVMNDDAAVHLKNLKPIPVVEDEVNDCIECGWCEPRCPSQGLTLTPRQRIVVRREIARLRDSSDVAEAALHKDLVEEYTYHGLETCATDGMCATACPVGINTGDLVKLLREEQHSARANAAAVKVAENFGGVETALKLGLQAGHMVSKLGAAPLIRRATQAASALVGERLPLWNERLGAPAKMPRTSFSPFSPFPSFLPNSPKNSQAISQTTEEFSRTRSATSAANADAIYFPACVSRMMGTPHSKSQSVVETLMTVAERAGVRLWIPDDVSAFCCGTPFSSKGFAAANEAILTATLERFWAWSDGGRLPIVTEASSCSYKFRSCGEELPSRLQSRFQAMTILDSIEFTHDVLLPKLQSSGRLHAQKQAVVLHPVCSVVKLGIDGKLQAIASACAESATVPINAGCCAFAGDRGMIAPELTANATHLEAKEVCERHYDGYFSSNPMCEAGMTTAVNAAASAATSAASASNAEYVSYLYLVEEATR